MPRGDILVVAIGRAKFVTAAMVKPGATVIDVGMNREKPAGCAAMSTSPPIEPVAGAITPGAGGVGPMTIAMLLKNTLTAARRQNGLL